MVSVEVVERLIKSYELLRRSPIHELESMSRSAMITGTLSA